VRDLRSSWKNGKMAPISTDEEKHIKLDEVCDTVREVRSTSFQRVCQTTTYDTALEGEKARTLFQTNGFNQKNQVFINNT
jgi:hypothetical protein